MFNLNELKKLLNPISITGNISEFNISGVITDTRQNCKNKMFLALEGENFNGHDFVEQAINAGCTALCLKQKIANLYSNYSIPIIGVQDTLKAYQLMAALHRNNVNCTVIGITGSSGKTSCKEILYSILSEKFGEKQVLCTKANTNNHIGVPLNLLNLNHNHKFAIIEMGTNHPGEIAVLAKIAMPDICIITSIGHAHIEAFKNLNGVAEEKTDVFMQTTNFLGKTRTPIAIIPDSLINNTIFKNKLIQHKILSFGSEPSADLQYKYLGGNFKGSSFSFKHNLDQNWNKPIRWQLHGAHQASNALAATLVALELNINLKIIEKALSKCSLPGMRMNIFEKDNNIFINDAYNANPESVIAVLHWLKEAANNENFKQQQILIILGDILESGENKDEIHYNILKLAIKLFPLSTILAVGNTMFKIASDLNSSNIYKFKNSIDTTDFISSITNDDKYIILLKGSRGIALENCCPK